MLLRFLLVDRDDQFRFVSREDVERVWNDTVTPNELGWSIADELRIVSVLAEDEQLQPQMCFFLRVEIREGRIVERSRHEAYDAMTNPAHARHDPNAAERQFIGWPGDWQHQLAVALDVPASTLNRVGLGGPLLMADLWGLPIEQILGYFDEACGEQAEH